MARPSLNVFGMTVALSLIAALALPDLLYAGETGDPKPTLTAPQNSAAPTAPAKAVKAKPKRDPFANKSSVQIISKLMEDPVVAAAYRDQEFRLLRTSIDLQDYNTLTSNALTQAALPDILQHLDEGIDESIASNNLVMTPLVDGIKSHEKLLALGRRASFAAGMTAKEIAQQQYFIASGPVNAYTQGKLFIVMYNGLTSQISYQEIVGSKLVNHLLKNETLGVLMHETHHEIFHHVLQGTLDMAMMIQLAKLFVGPGMIGGNTEELFKILAKDPASLPHSELWMSMASDLTDHMELWHKDPATGKPLERVRTQSRMRAYGRLSSAVQIMDNMREQMRAISEDQVKGEVDSYLSSMVNILQRSEVPSSTTEFFKTLLTTLRTKKNLDDVQVFGASEFVANFQTLFAVKQKERETSADNGMFVGGINPLLGTRLFMQFNAAPLDESPLDWPKYIEEIKKTEAASRSKVYEDYARMSHEQMDNIVGGSGKDHPHPAFRIMNLLDNAKTVDVVSMRDPFLRLVVIRNGLKEQQAKAEAQYQAALEKIEMAKTKMPKMVPALIRFAKKQKALADKSGPASDKVTAIILNKIERAGFTGVNLLYTKLLDYQLSRRGQVVNGLAEIDEQLKEKAIDENSAQFAIRFMKQYDSEGLDLVVLVADKIIKDGAAPERTQRRLRIIAETLSENISAAQIDKLRDALVHDSFAQGIAPSQKAFENRKASGTRITDRPEFVDRTSSVRERVMKNLPPAVRERSDALAVGPGWVQGLSATEIFNCKAGLNI